MSPPTKPVIGVGFVGLSSTGWASTALAPSLIQPSLTGAYDIVAVSTTSEESAKKSAEKYSKWVGHPIKAYFGDASRISADSDVDLVAVAVAAPHHKSVVMRAIEATKDFFVEWPAGASLKDTEEMAEAARKSGVRSIVGLQGRHSMVTRKVKELLSSGVIGTVRSTNVFALMPRELNLWTPFSSEKDLRLTQRENGSTMLDIPIIHQLDILTFLLGDFVTISATDAIFFPVGTVVDSEGKPTEKTYPSTNPDHFSITGFLESGTMVNIFWRAGYASSEGRRQYIWEIEGDEGSIRMEAPVAYPSIYEPDLYINGKKFEFDAPGDILQSLGVAWREFAAGGTGNFATIEDAVKNHHLIQAIEASARSGTRITLQKRV
ncbi:Dehydrogenase aclE [Psilocybe cubensis]|uniref:Gfo/Idh/MocA-like oxidoreductase N-terminal domain-containing protein n=2 Tax=Psilocybe cubensis TaxID=181762 RepID=A0A8H7XV99_PSICU|nr:Dehydrogenase aclE [Psilocybe cubensis]KAH9476876.1 Dehydrogenase aclE [Psilocybe cubensis]